MKCHHFFQSGHDISILPTEVSINVQDLVTSQSTLTSLIATIMCVLLRRKENQESVARVLREALEVQEHQAVLVALAQ